MNQFPVDYVAHNLPLILISGLESAKNGPSEENSKQRGVLYEGGFRIRTDEPPVRTQVAEYLLQAFLDHDGFEPEATGRVARNTDTKLFKIKNIGRVMFYRSGLHSTLLTILSRPIRFQQERPLLRHILPGNPLR